MRSAFETLQQKLATGDYSDFTVNVATLSGEPKNISLKMLIGETQAKGKSLILTFTPGPFKATDALPEGWMSCELAKGCTAQLAALDSLIQQDHGIQSLVDIYAVNVHNANYQSGENGLMKQKAVNFTGMISDPQGKFFETFAMPHITVAGKQYFERVTALIDSRGKVNIFELASPVNLELANEYATSIVKHLQPELRKDLITHPQP